MDSLDSHGPVTRWTRQLLRWLTVPYAPDRAARSYLERAETRTDGGLEVAVAVASDTESRRLFGVRMAHRGMQPVWIRIRNRTPESYRLDLAAVDPRYYTPLEAAYVNHFAIGRRLVRFGLLAWLYLPFLPLLPFKILGARAANRRMDAFFKAEGYPPGPIAPGGEKEGFVFTPLDEGLKAVAIRLLGGAGARELAFSLEVPGLEIPAEGTDPAEPEGAESVDEAGLRAWLEHEPRCTTNRRGTAEGDPLNLVVVGDRATVRQCFGAHWDDAEAIVLETCWKTLKAFLLGSGYRYAPVSPLYLAGRMQELALQRARATINERLHLRLWRAPLRFEDAPVWIGQVSRDIGVRFTWRTWNLTTHRIDPDVDEARDYVIDDLLAARRVARLGLADGAGAAPPESPRRNLTGDPYFTDGLRAVLVLSRERGEPTFRRWAGASA
jgi:hypothetical protein